MTRGNQRDTDRARAEARANAAAAMADMKAWLCQDMSLGRVAIFDGTNTTVARRTWILKELSDILSSKSNVVFVESICRDQEIIDYNILETKLRNPDYEGKDPEEAVRWVCCSFAPRRRAAGLCLCVRILVTKSGTRRPEQGFQAPHRRVRARVRNAAGGRLRAHLRHACLCRGHPPTSRHQRRRQRGARAAC